jgi:hypothetical protein
MKWVPGIFPGGGGWGVTPGNIPGTHFCSRLNQSQVHSAAGRMSMKNSGDTIENRTRDLPACSAVPQPTVPPRAPLSRWLSFAFTYICCFHPHLWQMLNVFLNAILRRSWLTTFVTYKAVHLPPMALQPLLGPWPLSEDASIPLTLLLVFSIIVFLGSRRNHILHFRSLNSSDVFLVLSFRACW